MHAATTLARALHACMRLLHTAAAEWLVVVPRRCRCSPPFGFWLQKATGGRQEAAHESAGQESCGDEEESSGDWSLSRFQDEWWEHSKGVREDTPDMVRWLRNKGWEDWLEEPPPALARVSGDYDPALGARIPDFAPYNPEGRPVDYGY